MSSKKSNSQDYYFVEARATSLALSSLTRRVDRREYAFDLKTDTPTPRPGIRCGAAAVCLRQILTCPTPAVLRQSLKYSPGRARRLAHSPLSAGFTLLEILIAMAILAVVATLVYASFDATIKVIDGVDHEANIYRDTRLILTKLSEDLSMAYIPKGLQEATFVGQDGLVEDRAQDSLKFTALSHVRVVPNQPTSDLNLIEYTLEADSERKDWVLLRNENANLYSLSREGGQYAIGEGIRGFNLRYFDGKTWVDSWDSAIHKGLPWVVEIEIQFQEPRGGQRSFKSWVELALAK